MAMSAKASDDIAWLPATAQLAVLAAKKVSSAELVELYLSRIDTYNASLNAIVTVDPDAARAVSHNIFQSLVFGAFAVDRSTLSPASAAALGLRAVRHPRGEAANALGATLQSHRAWLFADAARHEMRDRWAGFFNEFDVLLLPVTPTPAPLHHNKDHDRLGRTIDVDGVSRSYWDQLKWNALANIAGTPATTMPITTTATGLPIGIQAMGPAGGDRTTVEFAALLTEVLGGFRVPPL